MLKEKKRKKVLMFNCKVCKLPCFKKISSTSHLEKTSSVAEVSLIYKLNLYEVDTACSEEGHNKPHTAMCGL